MSSSARSRSRPKNILERPALLWRLFHEPPFYRDGKCVTVGRERTIEEFTGRLLRSIPDADVWRWRACIRAAHKFQRETS